MLHQLVESPGEADPEDLAAAYCDELAAVVDEVGVETAAERTGIDADTLADLSADLDLSDAAAIYALGEDRPDAEAIEQETLDEVLLGMTTAVLDVESVAANLDLDLSPKEVQQRIEGRAPMTVREFAHVWGFIAGEQR